MSSGDLASRLEALEARVRDLEDRAEISALVARYGPAVDAGDGGRVAALWAVDAEYSFDDTTLDAAGIRALVDLPTHRAYLSAGCAHVISAPAIEVGTDHAVAVTHSVVLVRDGAAWAAQRVSANHWRFARTAYGWRVQTRRNRMLDGAAAARALLQP